MLRHQGAVDDGRLLVTGGQAVFELGGGGFVGRPGNRHRRIGRVGVDVENGRRGQVGRLGREGILDGRGHTIAPQVAGIDGDGDGRIGRERGSRYMGHRQIGRRAGRVRLD